MNMKFFRAAAVRSFLMPLVAVVILGVAVASCSKDEALFDAIPAEVDNSDLMESLPMVSLLRKAASGILWTLPMSWTAPGSAISTAWPGQGIATESSM